MNTSSKRIIDAIHFELFLTTDRKEALNCLNETEKEIREIKRILKNVFQK